MYRYGIILILVSLSYTGAFAGVQDARLVFEKLVRSLDNSSVPRPSLKIIDNANLVANTFPSGEVMMGKQFIRHCSGFGSDSINAIACVMAHELVHYYQKHFWAQKFGSAYVDSDWGKKISEDENNRKYLELYETQADQLGFYYAFSSGYKTWQVAQPLLDSIYKWYKLKENLTGYPSLSQRKQMALTSAANIAQLIPVFEMSNNLKVISATYLDDQQSALLDFSVFGYEHLISSNIQTAEMYNNIAVSKILKAQKYNASKFSELQLPVILDQSSLMYEASGTKGDSEPDKFMQLMNEALDNVEQALKLNEYYWPASINKSLILLGLEKYGSCEDELNSKAIKGAMKNNRSMEYTVSEIKGILYYLKGDATNSTAQFKSAVKAGSPSAYTNELILKDKKDEVIKQAPGNSSVDTIEKWNGKPVYQGLKKYSTSTDHVISYSNTKAELLVDSANGYKVYELRQKIGFCPVQYVKIAMKNDPGISTSRGLKTGQSVSEMTTKYGKTNIKVSGTLYTYWLYPKQNLVVTIDNTSQKVEGWFYYMLD